MKRKYHHKYKKEQIVAQQLDTVLIKRLMSYLFPFKKWILVAVVLLLTAKGIEAYIPLFIGKITQQIMLHVDAMPASKASLMSSVTHGCLLALCLLGISYLCDCASMLIKNRIGQQAINNMRRQVYQHIIQMPLPFFDKNAVGRLITRTIHDVEQVDLMFTDSLVPLFGNLFLFSCIAVAMVFIDWRAALLMACVLPFVGWILFTFRANQRRVYEMIRGVISAFNTFIQENISGVTTIRNFGLIKKERRRFDDINEDYCNAYMESIEHFGFFIAGLDFLSNVTLISLFMLLVLIAMPPAGFQIGTYFAFSLYTMMFFRPLIDLAERYNILQAAFAASERIFELLDAKEEELGPKEGLELHNIETIVFDNVWMAYEEDHWILKGLSFTLHKGDSLAIVGITGSGKTSIMSLLLRLYDFQKGSITINGYDIRAYSTKSLRSKFSMMFQDPVIFSGTFYDNITLFNPEISRARVEEIVDFVQLRPVILRYSEGLDHALQEHGKGLSMGEMQLVSMARAIAHEGSVLLFDEATAHIDSITEKAIQETMQKIIKKKTVIVIAHRLSTIRNMPRILVIHQGVLVEEGTHDELMQLNGIYKKLQFWDAVP